MTMTSTTMPDPAGGRPIETAPEDQYILLNHEGWYPCVTLGYRSGDKFFGICVAGYPPSKHWRQFPDIRPLNPTKWWPLPCRRPQGALGAAAGDVVDPRREALAAYLLDEVEIYCATRDGALSAADRIIATLDAAGNAEIERLRARVVELEQLVRDVTPEWRE